MWLNELCENCGLTRGSHHGGSGHKSSVTGMYYFHDMCPGHEGRMDWQNGGGTGFFGSREYGAPEYGTPAKNIRRPDHAETEK
jgi:hypothetical protein